jgi:hypothetical protein
VSEQEQINQFANALDKLVDRMRDEYELSYAAIVGVLHFKAHLLCGEATERGKEE